MQVFETSSLAGIRIKNRILRSATYEGMCDTQGHPQASYYELYDKLSSGGAGAIITGFVAVDRTGRMPSRMGLIDNDAYIEDFKKLCVTVHENDTPIIMQIVHCGGFSSKAFTHAEPVAPSPFVNLLALHKARKLSETGIEKIIDDFVKAIVRVRASGIDGVQLHAAHGYLLSEEITYRLRQTFTFSNNNLYKLGIIPQCKGNTSSRGYKLFMSAFQKVLELHSHTLVLFWNISCKVDEIN